MNAREKSFMADALKWERKRKRNSFKERPKIIKEKVDEFGKQYANGEEEYECVGASSEDDRIPIYQRYLSKSKPTCVLLPARSRSTERMQRIGDGNENKQLQHSSIMEDVRNVEANMDHNFPRFTKLLKHSHVKRGFWLNMPAKFCRLNLHGEDQKVLLEDGSGKLYEANYVASKMGLSGGWRGFSIKNKLLEGDAAIFQLVQFVKPCKFKVYIVRARCSDELDSAPGMPHHNVDSEKGDSRKPAKCGTVTERPGDLDGSLNHDPADCGNGSENFDNAPSTNLGPTFVDFEGFIVSVNEDFINSMLPQGVLSRYYSLCLAQGSYLHRGLLRTVDSTLAAGIISATTNIADAIKGCTLSASPDDFAVWDKTFDFAVWDKTLEGLEILGMDVQFLRARIKSLVSLATKSQEILKSRSYAETRINLEQVEKKIDDLLSELDELGEAREKLVPVMNALKYEIQRNKEMFREEANRPWP